MDVAAKRCVVSLANALHVAAVNQVVKIKAITTIKAMLSQEGAGKSPAPAFLSSVETAFLKNYVPTSLRILLSGSTGFIGSALHSFLQKAGHEVVLLKRGKETSGKKELFWDPKGEYIETAPFENFDAVIHLAGKNIASGLWTSKHKREVYSSRVEDTRKLAETLAQLDQRPKTFLCASAIGVYGSRGREILNENSPPGSGFLAETCRDWEGAASGVKGVRCVQTRFGNVLSPGGGMLQKLIPLFRAHLGAVLGSGEQMMSWIALEDVVFALYHCLMTTPIEGPVNVTAPNPVSNRDFSEKLAGALHKKLWIRIGEKPLCFFLGQMGEEMLLSSCRVMPEKLSSSGYRFQYPELNAFFKQHFS